MGRVLSNIIFYTVLIGMLLFVLLYSQSTSGKNIFGFSYFNILTTSMQSEIPQGSFILVKQTPGNELKIGDDIAFFKNADTVVTHRIINIIENYEDSGQLGFQTQGVDNPLPDREITYEGNVIGKVVFHIPMLGFILQYIAQHLMYVIVAAVLLFALAFFLKIVFTPEKPSEDSNDN